MYLHDPKIENVIMKKLAIHDAIGYVKLYGLVYENDVKDNLVFYKHAIASLMSKGLIDLIKDSTNTMDIVRNHREVYH